MRLVSVLSSALLAVSLAAQNTGVSVNDVGLTMLSANSTGSVSAVVGQACGPFTCTPFRAPVPTPSTTPTTRLVRVHGDASSLFVLFLSPAAVATPCVPINGIGNALLFGNPLHTVAVGVTGGYVPSTTVACRQGIGTYQLTLPPVAPAVIVFRMQALTFSFTTGGPAFTVPIEVTAR